jgi:hypothetical protein
VHLKLVYTFFPYRGLIPRIEIKEHLG